MSLAHTIVYDISSQTPVANAVLACTLSDGFRNQVVTLVPAGTVSMTFKFAASDQDTQPDFAATSTATNQWQYIDVIDLADGSSIDWATGVALTTTATRRLEYNSNVSKWIGIVCTAYSTWTIAGKIALSTNQ